MRKCCCLALLLVSFVFFSIGSYAGNGPKGRTFVLVNGQHREAFWKGDLNVPILLFCMNIGDDGKARLGLLEAFPAEGDRELQVLNDYGIICAELSAKNSMAVFDLNDYGQKEWIKQYRHGSVVSGAATLGDVVFAKTIDNDGIFFANKKWENGEKANVTFLTGSHKSGKAVFLRDNIIIEDRTIESIMSLPGFLIVYDKSASRLANWSWKEIVEKNGSLNVHRAIQTFYPLACDYPQALMETLSSSVYENVYHSCCSMIRNDKKTRLIACLNPENKELFFYSYDYEKKEWNSMAFSDVRPYGEYGESWSDVLKWTKWRLGTLMFEGMHFSVIDSWLCLSTKCMSDGPKDLVFISLPDLKERFRWTGVLDLKKILYMKDGVILFASKENIWLAEYDENGVFERRLLMSSPYIDGVHSAFEVPEGSLGDPSEWREPKLYQRSFQFRTSGTPVKYFAAEPQP